MSPARWPRDAPLDERMLRIDPASGRLGDGTIRDLSAGVLRAADLLVVNDAATLPASLASRAPSGEPIEVRLAAPAGEPGDGDEWWAVLFGDGDWRTPTEHRPAPVALGPGATLAFEPRVHAADARAHAVRLGARVAAVSPISSRLVRLRFDRRGAALHAALYALGRPVQYSYVADALELWHVQTRYGSRPWAAELPSAGRPLAWELLLDLARRGVRLACVTHATGLSSTGDAALDAALPLPERFDVPAETVAAVARARAAGGRVVAVGTSVVRALEGCARANDGRLVAGSGETSLVIRAGFRPRVVDGLLTGIHDPAASHFDLLRAFAPEGLLARAHAHAEAAGYLCHEFGDSALVLAGAA